MVQIMDVWIHPWSSQMDSIHGQPLGPDKCKHLVHKCTMLTSRSGQCITWYEYVSIHTNVVAHVHKWMYGYIHGPDQMDWIHPWSRSNGRMDTSMVQIKWTMDTCMVQIKWTYGYIHGPDQMDNGYMHGPDQMDNGYIHGPDQMDVWIHGWSRSNGRMDTSQIKWTGYMGPDQMDVWIHDGPDQMEWIHPWSRSNGQWIHAWSRSNGHGYIHGPNQMDVCTSMVQIKWTDTSMVQIKWTYGYIMVQIKWTYEYIHGPDQMDLNLFLNVP